MFPLSVFRYICSNNSSGTCTWNLSLSWYDILKLVIPIRISFTTSCC